MDANARLEKLYRIIRDAELDALALIPGPNHRYLTGAEHYVLERPIVTFYTPDDKPSRGHTRSWRFRLFERHPIGGGARLLQRCRWIMRAHSVTALDRLNVGGKTIGVEGLHMRFFEGEVIRQSASDAAVVDATEALAELRTA